MNTRMKIIFSLALVILLSFTIYFFGPKTNGSVAVAQTQQTGTETRTVSVFGVGEIQAEPDVAVIRLGVQTEAESAQDALNQNSDQMQDVVAALRDSGVNTQDIQTQTIRLSAQYDFDSSNNRRTLVGYLASNVVEAHTRDLAGMGDLLDQAVTAGANTIENIHFEVSNASTLTDDAREAAVQDARQKAEQLAELTGASLGSVYKIHETSRNASPVVRQEFELAVADSATVPVEPGTVSITVEVQIVWVLTE